MATKRRTNSLFTPELVPPTVRGFVGSAAVIVFLLLSSSVPLAGAEPVPPEPTVDPVLKVGSPDEMKTRNPLPAIASEIWTRSVLDRVYATVLLRNSTTEAPIAYIAKGVDIDEDGMFEPSTEYDAWAEQPGATTPLAITVYYDFNGVRWHDGMQMDVWDLFFSYHLNAMHPIWNSALRILFAGGTAETYERGLRQLNVSLAVKSWEGEGILPGDASLRIALAFTLNGPWALFPRTLSPKLFSMQEWSRTGGNRHADFGCAIWIPTAVAVARGIPECGTSDQTLWGQGVKPTDIVPGSKPFDYASAEAWPMTDADVVGSGPFTFAAWIQGVQSTLDRNDDYYMGVDAANGTVYDGVLPTRIHKPFIGGIRFLVYRTMLLLVLALQANEIDYIHWNIPPEFVPELLSHPEIAITANAEPGFSYLGYNLRRQPWGYNPTNQSRDDGFVLRSAVAGIIDKRAIVVNLLQNFGFIGYGVVNPANTYWYNDNIPKYPYDLVWAMAILDSPEARAVGIGPKPSGQIDTLCDQNNPGQCRTLPRLGNQPFYILTPAADYDPVRSAAGAMIASAMRWVGLNAVAQPTAFGSILTAITTHSFDLYILDWGLDTIDPDYMFDLFHSSNAPAGQNYVGFNNATFDDAIDRSRAEPDRPTRRGYIFTAQRIIAEARPYEVLYYRTRIEAYRQDRFVNWTLSFGTLWNYWSLLGIHPPDAYVINVTTSPPGLSVVVRGITQAAPAMVACTSGQTILVGVSSPQIVGGSRFTFASWSDGGAEWHAISCTGNATLTATFSTEHLLTVETVPSGLDVTVEGATAPAPVSRWCPEGSTITISAPSPQGTGDTRHVFVSWSDGGSRTHSVTCTVPATYVAAYSADAYLVTVDTSPSGLQVEVDGSAYAAPYALWCSAGTTATLSVPSPQGSGGTRYVFALWSDGGTRTHTISCTAPATITANLTTEHLLTVETEPSGLDVIVGDITAPAPVSRWCAEGSTTAIAAPSPQGTGDTRHVFASWSDGWSAAHQVSCAAPTTVTATFATEYRITVDSNPAGAPLTLDGAAATVDGLWCSEGGTVSIGAPREASLGARPYRFVRWSDGGTQEHEVICSAPALITATFEEVLPPGEMPFIEQYRWALLGIVVAAVVLAVLFAVAWRRKKKQAAP